MQVCGVKCFISRNEVVPALVHFCKDSSHPKIRRAWCFMKLKPTLFNFHIQCVFLRTWHVCGARNSIFIARILTVLPFRGRCWLCRHEEGHEHIIRYSENVTLFTNPDNYKQIPFRAPASLLPCSSTMCRRVTSRSLLLLRSLLFEYTLCLYAATVSCNEEGVSSVLRTCATLANKDVEVACLMGTSFEGVSSFHARFMQ